MGYSPITTIIQLIRDVIMYQLVKDVDIEYVNNNKAYSGKKFIGFIEDDMIFPTKKDYDNFLHETNV